VVLAVFGLGKKGTAAGLCWVELETVRRKWKASVQRAGLGCRCWRLMWVWPWLVFCERELLRDCLGSLLCFFKAKGGKVACGERLVGMGEGEETHGSKLGGGGSGRLQQEKGSFG
jgi:hypothetical protein